MFFSTEQVATPQASSGEAITGEDKAENFLTQNNPQPLKQPIVVAIYAKYSFATYRHPEQDGD